MWFWNPVLEFEPQGPNIQNIYQNVSFFWRSYELWWKVFWYLHCLQCCKLVAKSSKSGKRQNDLATDINFLATEDFPWPLDYFNCLHIILQRKSVIFAGLLKLSSFWWMLILRGGPLTPLKPPPSMGYARSGNWSPQLPRLFLGLGNCRKNHLQHWSLSAFYIIFYGCHRVGAKLYCLHCTWIF